jgi:hypothetical protein
VPNGRNLVPGRVRHRGIRLLCQTIFRSTLYLKTQTLIRSMLNVCQRSDQMHHLVRLLKLTARQSASLSPCSRSNFSVRGSNRTSVFGFTPDSLYQTMPPRVAIP